MTARTIGDCEACKDALTELVCDELDDATREAVLAHTQGCTSCAAELVKLRAVMQVAESMPLEAPSPRVRSAVMLAAREASARRAALPQAPARASESKLDILRTWLTQLGTWAMSPQVAMASVLLLMLGVGLVALPLGQDREQAALRAAEEAHEAPSPTASGTAIVPPASAPPSEESSRGGDVAEREQADDAKNAYAMEQAVQAKPSAQRRDAARAASKAFAGKKAPPLDDLVLEEGARKRDEMAPLGNVSPAGGSSALAAQEAFPDMATSKAARSRSSVKGTESDFAPAPPPKPAAAAPSPAAEPSIASESAGYEAKDEEAPEAQLLAQGVSAARNGDYTGAIGLLRPLASKGSPTVRREASLWLARSYRALDKCGEALRYYASLVEATNASQALITEAIDCYDRTGATKQAAALRSRITPSKAKKGSAEEPAAAPKD